MQKSLQKIQQLQRMKSKYCMKKKKSLIKPERRYLKQILVQEEDEAKNIALQLGKGTNFSNVAKELASLDESDIDLGWNTKTELPEEVIEEVFKVKKNKITKPIQSSFGWHIFLVLDIEAKKNLPNNIEDVKNKFRNELLIEKGKEAVFDLQDEVEDSLAGGESLLEISQKLEVKLIEAKKIDNEGTDINGKKNLEFQDARILRAVFNQKENEEGNLIDIDDDNGLAVSIVKKIYPPRQMSIEEARPIVVSELKKDSRFQKALEFAKKLKLEIESNSIENVTNKYNLELKGVAPFNRIRPDDSELPLPLIDKIFTSKLSDILNNNRSDQEVIVSQVEEIINAYGKDKSDMKAFNKRIENDMSVDLLSQFSEVLRKNIKSPLMMM